MRATAHSVSSACRPPDDTPDGPSFAIPPAHRLPPGTSTSGVTGSDVSMIGESSSCQPTPAIATRGGDATTAVVRLFIIAASLRRNRLVDAWAVPPGTPDVASRRRGVRRRAMRGALTRIVAVGRHVTPHCGGVCRRVSSLYVDKVPSVCFIHLVGPRCRAVCVKYLSFCYSSWRFDIII